VGELRHLYRSVIRMARSDAVDTLLNYLVEDIIEITKFERVIVLFYNQQMRTLESRIFYGLDDIQDINIPFSQVNGLLKRAYADREPLNVIKNKEPDDQSGQQMVKCGIFKDDYPIHSGRSRRRHINICFKDMPKFDTSHFAQEDHQFKHYSQLTYYQHDKTVESLLGNTTSFLIIPICDDHTFYGYVLADKPSTAKPVNYNEARISSAIVSHSAQAIGRAMKHHDMLMRIAKQNKELGHHLEKNEELKSFYESIFQGLRSGLITADKNLIITHLNKSVTNMMGYQAEELIGTPIPKLFKTPEENIKAIFREGGQCIDPRTGYLSEFEVICHDQTLLPVEVCFSTIIDKDGGIAGLSCIFLDITQRKKMEKHLARMDRLASLGELASGIAHEIRNPLAGIAGALQIIGKEFTDDNPNQDIFHEVLSQVKRLDKFVKNLLQFARPNNPTMEPLQLNDVIDSSIFLVTSQLDKKQINLEIKHHQNQPYVQGDRGLLQQALLNIIINALDAMPDKGTLKIETNWTQNKKQNKHNTPLNCIHSDDTITITITDNGPGIKEDHMETIFNPFFTTKSQGTGLGLAITHRIIEQHNGTIFVNSSPGHGTAFTITLPINQEQQFPFKGDRT
jgi:PAS domain S-box-containing protein